jgi:hypothetical protein
VGSELINYRNSVEKLIKKLKKAYGEEFSNQQIKKIKALEIENLL